MIEFGYLVAELINELYSRNTEPRDTISKNTDSFNRLTTSTDILSDTYVALIYFENEGFGKQHGEILLSVYGVLQAIFLQQDTINTIYEIIMKKIPELNENSGWSKIRFIRNLTIGHPIRKKTKSVDGISTELSTIFVPSFPKRLKETPLEEKHSQMSGSFFNYISEFQVQIAEKGSSKKLFKELEFYKQYERYKLEATIALKEIIEQILSINRN